jgi:hypothetical protein
VKSNKLNFNDLKFMEQAEEEHSLFIDCVVFDLAAVSTFTHSTEQVVSRIDQLLAVNYDQPIEYQIQVLNTAKPCGITWKPVINSQGLTMTAESVHVFIKFYNFKQFK